MGVVCMRHTIETAPRNGNLVILEDDARGSYDVAHWSPGAGEWIGENSEPIKIMPSHWYPMPVVCMRDTIKTAPRNGNLLILEDDARGTYDVAHWSPEAGEWIGENGEPIKNTPSHWYPMPGENYLQQGDRLSSGLSEASTSASRARRHRFFPFFSIAATLVAAALIGVYFRSEPVASVTRYADLQDISRIGMIGEQLVEQATELLSQGPLKAYLRALQEQAEADQVSVQEAALVRQALPMPAPEARQSSENEPRQEVLAKEPAEARRAVDGLNLKLQAEVATAARSLGQEREKMAALMQDADAARQALTASTAQHRQALDEERARSDALASELAAARRDLDTKVALLSKADDVPTQVKPAPESATAELRQSLQQEHDRAEALATELARRDIETRDIDEAAQLKQAVESATAELRQSLQQEHDRAEALATEPAKARRDVDQKPAAVEERPGVSLPAWANSDALVKPAQAAKQPDVTPENSKPAIEPVQTATLPRERAMRADNGYSCQRYRTYDPASGTYRGYDGRRHSCP
jgi:hypothetical protein